MGLSCSQGALSNGSNALIEKTRPQSFCCLDILVGYSVRIPEYHITKQFLENQQSCTLQLSGSVLNFLSPTPRNVGHFGQKSAFGLALLAVFGAQMLRNASADRFRSPLSGHLRLHVFTARVALGTESRSGHVASRAKWRRPKHHTKKSSQVESHSDGIVPGPIAETDGNGLPKTTGQQSFNVMPSMCAAGMVCDLLSFDAFVMNLAGCHHLVPGRDCLC